MVVVVIIGILAGVAVPLYSGYLRRSKITDAYMSLEAISKAEVTYWMENKEFRWFGMNPLNVAGLAQ